VWAKSLNKGQGVLAQITSDHFFYQKQGQKLVVGKQKTQ